MGINALIFREFGEIRAKLLNLVIIWLKIPASCQKNVGVKSSIFKEIESVLKNKKNLKGCGCTQGRCLVFDKTYSKILSGPANSRHPIYLRKKAGVFVLSSALANPQAKFNYPRNPWKNFWSNEPQKMKKVDGRTSAPIFHYSDLFEKIKLS